MYGVLGGFDSDVGSGYATCDGSDEDLGGVAFMPIPESKEGPSSKEGVGLSRDMVRNVLAP